jgi:calcium/calmodulin-dependent protein kinase I
MAKGLQIEFSHPSQEVITMWVAALKTSIILTDLKEDFVIG